jgi:hypothetical protein
MSSREGSDNNPYGRVFLQRVNANVHLRVRKRVLTLVFHALCLDGASAETQYTTNPNAVMSLYESLNPQACCVHPATRRR